MRAARKFIQPLLWKEPWPLEDSRSKGTMLGSRDSRRCRRFTSATCMEFRVQGLARSIRRLRGRRSCSR